MSAEERQLVPTLIHGSTRKPLKRTSFERACRAAIGAFFDSRSERGLAEYEVKLNVLTDKSVTRAYKSHLLAHEFRQRDELSS